MSECHCDFREDCCCQEDDVRQNKRSARSLVVHLFVISAALAATIVTVKLLKRR